KYSLSGANGKGHFDFTIMQDESIFCVIEINAVNIEHGLCQNLVQTQRLVNLKVEIKTFFVMVQTILLDKIKSLEEPQQSSKGLITF
ncbi:34747_t:CDS:2, partial [Gigaspora margarita]